MKPARRPRTAGGSRYTTGATSLLATIADSRARLGVWDGVDEEEEMSDVHVREQCPICQQPVLFSSDDLGCCGLPTTPADDSRHKVARCATTFKMCSSAHLWRCVIPKTRPQGGTGCVVAGMWAVYMGSITVLVNEQDRTGNVATLALSHV